MWPRPALLLLGLGLLLGCSRLSGPPAPRGGWTIVPVPRALAPGQGLLGHQAHRPAPRVPLQPSLGPSEWTLHLQPVRPPGASSASYVAPRSLVPRGPRHDFVAQSTCPTAGPTPVVLEAANSHSSHAVQPGVSCEFSAQTPCVIKKVKINRDKDGSPLVLTRKTSASLNASFEYDCPVTNAIVHRWTVFSVPSLSDVPDWKKPLAVPELQFEPDPTIVHIPKGALTWGVYVFRFSLILATMGPQGNVVRDSDYIYVTVVRSLLKAVIFGESNITVNYTDGLVLNGSGSSDPDADDPLEGLHFFWFCTTNPSNYNGDKISVVSQDVCLPAQSDLKWTWASGPELTLLPAALQGGRVYFFRMVIQKGDRAAFSDKRVRVLQGPTPIATISCIENCDSVLVISDRFSLFLNCTNCAASHDIHKWSILSSSGNEVGFDWTGQTSTGRESNYLSIKAFALKHFIEAKFWISLDLATWSGATLVLRHPFIVNHPPEIGECKINPADGIAFFTKFVVQCIDFKDQNMPLTYKMIVSDLHGFGEISSLKENTLGSLMYMGNGPTSPPSFLPVGVLVNHYALKIYVQVYDSLEAFSQVTLYATVHAPTDKISSRTVLHQLLNFTTEPDSALSTLLRNKDFLPAGYLMYIVASVLNSLKTEPTLQADKFGLREHLVNQSFVLPVISLVEISQVVRAIAELTKKHSEFTRVAQKLATVRIWQANQALQQYQQKGKHVRAEQIEVVSTGILTSLSNILKMTARHEVVDDPFYVLESLADTVLTGKVPGNETTVMRASSFNIYVTKTEKWLVGNVLGNEGRNCFHPVLNVSSVPTLSADAPVSMMFCEFADDPFPWLNYQKEISTDVVGFRMTGATAHGDVLEIAPDAAEVYLKRKNLSSATFSLLVGPDSEPDTVAESLRRTAGAFRFEVDSGAAREVLVHIVTEVTVLFTVSVYAGSQITPAALVATFLVPPDIPPVANQSGLFDPACPVKMARVVCLPLSLLQVVAQRSPSAECSLVLRAPRFVTTLTDKLVRIALFSIYCLDLYKIQSDWREDICVVGEKTTWDRVHCVCRNAGRARRQLDAIKLANVHLRARYLTAKVIVVPNPVDLRLEVIKNIAQNPVTVFTVLFIMVTYIVLAFWALHRDEADQFLREHVIVLPDNDPYDTVCYLVTIFTGSRCGAGTRADVFVQLRGTESSSDVHCLSHPQFITLYRGSINTFLLTTKSDLGDIHSIRVWHNNEGKAPSWYLSRIKVENLFSRHIWLFMCREWLSVDTSLDRTFHVTDPDEPLKRKDFFLIEMTNKLGKSHMWFSVFAGVTGKPFNRLQRLSCCLAMLLSSLVCNIMFFNLNRQEETESEGSRHLRSMVIGLESVLITLPVQLMITFLFTCSQRLPQVTLEAVSPQRQPVMSAASGHWGERLEKWHAHETAEAPSGTAEKSPSRRNPGLHASPVKAPVKTRHRPKKAESKSSRPPGTDAPANAMDTEGAQGAHFADPPSQPGPPPLSEKPRVVLPGWCVHIAWLLVFATCGVSSFFIVFYGLTYGYEKSIEWLFASFCSFCQSVFLVQPLKIMSLSSIRLYKLKFCKNLPWVSSYHYTEIKLQDAKLPPGDLHERHKDITRLRGTGMYQPLTEDEIRIFQRKKRTKRRAVLFLSDALAHAVFLALLLSLVTLLCHSDSFYYNQFIRDQFSVDLATVTKLEDIYRWLNSVLLPLFHNNLNPTFLPASSSKILGLPLMRQVRAKPGGKACLPANSVVPDSLKREIHCHPKYGADPEDTRDYRNSWNEVEKQAINKNTNGFTYKPREKRWGYYSQGLLHTYGSGGYAFYFFPDQQQFNSTVRLNQLQSSSWLDDKTWAVVLDLTTFNPDVSLFCSLSVVFEVSQLGVVNTSVSVHSFSLADFNRKTSAEIYLYGAILIFFLAYAVHEGHVITQERADYVRSTYNWLNVALKCTLAALIALFSRKHFLATGIMQVYAPGSAAFIPFHAVSQADRTLRIVLGFLLFLTILKTLRYARFFYDVRLAQRAVHTALPGICHVTLVVSAYFFMYVALGRLVFGQHEWNYSSLVHATQTVLAYCVSAFENSAFSHSRVLGVLFLSSFLLVMICTLINLFPAVILVAYGDMQQPTYEEPSDEAEAVAYLCGKLRTVFGFLSCQPKAKHEPEFLVHMLYGQPGKSRRRYVGLKTRSINGKKMVYLVV